MYYTFGDITIHFSLFQGNIYIASWDGDNSASDKRGQFIDLIHQKTGIDKAELVKAVDDYYGPDED